MIIETNKGQKCDFYIARVGRCAGKPMTTPYSTVNNCFAVISDEPELDFARIQCAYRAKEFEYFAHGTVQSVLRITYARDIAKKSKNLDLDLLKKLSKSIAVEIKLKEQIESLNKTTDNLAYSLFNRTEPKRNSGKYAWRQPDVEDLRP